MNSYQRGLRNGVLVNPKLFILEKVNLAPPYISWSTWSILVKLVKNLYYLVRVFTPRSIWLVSPWICLSKRPSPVNHVEPRKQSCVRNTRTHSQNPLEASREPTSDHYLAQTAYTGRIFVTGSVDVMKNNIKCRLARASTRVEFT